MWWAAGALWLPAGYPRPLACSLLHLNPEPTQMAIPLQME